MTPKMTSERKQEWRDKIAPYSSDTTLFGIRGLGTVGELRELLTEKVCEWWWDDMVWQTSCGSNWPNIPFDLKECPKCGGKVTVTR